MKKKPLAHYLDLMQSARDKQDWNKIKRYGEITLKKLPNLSCSVFDKYLLYCRLGFAYFQLSKYSISLDMYYTAHLIASKYHLPPERLAYLNFCLGNNLLNLYRPDQAILQFLKVEEYYQKYGDDKFPMTKEQRFLTLVNLGWGYAKKGELEKAREIIQEKLPPYQNVLTYWEQYYNLKGVYLVERKEYTQARQSFNEFLKINIEQNNLSSILIAKLSLIMLDILEGQSESVIRTLKVLMKDARQLKLNKYICIIVLVLSKCYLFKNMPAKSASVEKMIIPFLKLLDITWFYEKTRDIERFCRELQPIYQNLGSPLIPKIVTDKIEKHYQSSPYAKVIIAKSNSMMEVLQLVEKIAPTNLPVLIQGETGTGKELVAHAIHNNSLRKEKLWLALNCGALQETLLGNELFGHTKGAFTDAKGETKGYIELASEGTLFIDEIGDMSQNMQQKLLRVLEEKLVWRLGAQKPVAVNTRFIFASNQNIEELVRQTSTGSVQGKRFREDLYYRINTIVITLPPLRERKEDIPLLINHFLKKIDERKEMEEKTLKLLMAYNWPGNIRELENEIKRFCTLYPKTQVITESMISESIRISAKAVISIGNNLKGLTDDFQRQTIKQAMIKCNGNLSQAARLLGYAPANLYRKMKQLSTDTPKSVTQK